MTVRNVPGVKVEVAFGTNPNDPAAVAAMTSASWTDISGRVRGAQFDRPKRTAELDRFEAGTAKLVLDNFDGAFSPTNISSPYAGQLVPYRMIRIRALWASTYYPLWQGYVERWPTSWVDPAQGVTEIECVDAMAVAAQIGMSSVYESEVLADTPLFYYPLTDASGSLQASNQSTTQQQQAVIFHDSLPVGTSDGYAFGSTLPIPGAEQSGLSLTPTVPSTGGDYSGYGLRLPFIDFTWDAWTFEFWFSASPGATGVMLMVFDAGSTRNWAVSIALDNGGHIDLSVRTPDGVATGTWISTNGGYDNDTPHHILLSWTSPTAHGYVDDSLVFNLTCTGSTFTGSRQHLVQFGSEDTVGSGIPNKQSDKGTAAAFAGTLGQVAFYDFALPTTRINTHYSAGHVALAGQLPGPRASSLLRYADWPGLDLEYNGSTTLQAAANIAGRSLLECLQDIADTEQSELFSLADGRLCLTYRGQRMDQTAPVATFGGNIAAGEIPVILAGLQLDYDPTLVYNDVSIARNGGSTARVYDAASILAYFTRSFSRTSYADNDQDAQNAAAWLLDRYSQPQPRVETITIDAAAMGSDVTNFWPTILGLDLSDRVLLNHDPMGTAPLIALPGFLDQLSHAIDPDAGTWTVTIQISPLFHEYFALASDTDPTWDAASTPDTNGYIYLSY